MASRAAAKSSFFPFFFFFYKTIVKKKEKKEKKKKKRFPVGPFIVTRPLHRKQFFFKGGLGSLYARSIFGVLRSPRHRPIYIPTPACINITSTCV